jgi:hypothetical protein
VKKDMMTLTEKWKNEMITARLARNHRGLT